MTESRPFPSHMPAPGEECVVQVFVNGPNGGNPVPLVADASLMVATQMQEVARRHGHESSFVLPATVPEADWRLRFYVPLHEMEMCGHATVGTLWALRRWGQWTTPTARIETLSGIVDAIWDEAAGRVWISQPPVRESPLDDPQMQRVADALRLDRAAIESMRNAATSRVKTLVRLADVAALQSLAPDFDAVAQVCEEIGSTGLYPYALDHGNSPAAPPTVFARQFPKSSGYPEDAATGIAAAALWGYLAARDIVAAGDPAHAPICMVRQGDAMGRPSAIEVRARFDAGGLVAGCWLSGKVEGA